MGSPDWGDGLAVECGLYEEDALINASTVERLPEGAVVEVPELPELDDTVNASGVYMTAASALPLAPGLQTLTFNVTVDGKSASTTCSIERPVFPVSVEPVARTTEPFARAEIVYALSGDDGSSRKARLDAALTPEGQFEVSFKPWKPKSVEVNGAAAEVDEGGYLQVPVDAAVGAKASFRVTNLDDQSVDFEVELVELQPWADDDVEALASGAEAGYAWAASGQDPAAEEGSISALLVEPSAKKILRHVGPMRALSEVERVAVVERDELTVDVCEYSGGAKIWRMAERAKITLFDAKTGAKLASKTLRGKPPRCPKTAEFTVFKTDENDPGGAAFDQRLEGPIGEALDEWFDTHSQR